MALPAGITTATVLFGKDFDVLGGGNDVTLRITPSHTLIWEATGDRLTAFDVAVSAESDTVGTFELPHTDQTGFINEAGAEITDWWYTIVGTVRAGRAQKTYTKRVQVTSDVTSFDLDTLPVNTSVGPVGSVPLPTLTSVNGQTGAVVLTASAVGAVPNTSEGRQALAESTELLDTIAGEVSAAVPPQVAAVIATDPSVAEAAATLAQSNAGLVTSNPISEDVVAFTDAAGRRSWLEVAVASGGPSTHAAEMIWATQQERVATEAQAAGVADLDSEKYDAVFALRDASGRYALRVRSNGQVEIPDLRSSNALTPDSVTDTFLAPDVRNRLWPKRTGSTVTAVGDSQTAPGSGYASFLSSPLGGASVAIEAMGGHGLNEIAARQGGRPARATVEGNTIPSGTTPVAVTLDVDLLWRSAGTTGTTTRSCVLAGVVGTLTRDNTTLAYTFTRATAGSAVWVSPSTAIRTANGLANRDSILVFLAGRNGIHWTTSGSGLGAPWTPALLVERMKQMVAYQHERGGRFLVLELYPTQNTNTTERKDREAEYNSLLREAFPDAFVPTTYYLLNRAMSDMGVTPTTQDLADVAAGVPPTSLMADSTHLNDTGNQALAVNIVAREIIQRGWLN